MMAANYRIVAALRIDLVGTIAEFRPFPPQRPLCLNHGSHLIMPAVALGWYFAASLLRLTRSSRLEALLSEYVKLARLKGLPSYVVLVMHAFNNALIPVLSLA